jgi:superfamily II DNA or RNA helicase
VSRQTLRSYQQELVAGVECEWARGFRSVAMVLPTGGGKTTTFAEVIERWLAGPAQGRRAVVMAHRTELVEQAADRIRAHSNVPVGIVKAERNQTRAPVVVGSVQTLAPRGGRRARMISDVGLVVVDECHRAAALSYTTLIGGADTSGVWADAQVLGVTATLTRSDRLSLGDVWQTVVAGPPIMWMVDNGYLVRPWGLRVRVEDLDMRRVRKAGGDYRDADLGAAITDSMAPKRIAEAVREHADDRQGIVFAPTVAAAQAIADALSADGRVVRLVHGGTPAPERAQALREYTAGDVQFLCNCAVFTEGTDLPVTSVVVIARPTLHDGLYIQMAGRGLRTHSGKSDCLILDVVGATARHTLQAQIDLFGDQVAEEIEKEADDAEPLELPDEPIDDLDVRFDEDAVRDDPRALVAEIVDLFHKSDQQWSRTAAGVWFLPTRERFIVVLPGLTQAGGFDVWSVPKNPMHEWVPVSMGVEGIALARMLVEAQVGAHESIGTRKAGWRRATPSPGLLALARRWGVHDGSARFATAGELSARVTVAEASRRIDPHLPAQLFA